jgi:hypothetical protein
MPRRRREELRRINQRLVAELAAAPLADRAAFLERKRAEVAAVVEREGLPSGHSTLITELVLAHFAHLRGLSDAGAEAYSLAAVLRSLDTPGSLVRDFGLLDHLHDLRSALNAADQGRAGPLMRRLPPKKPNGGRPRDTTSALMDGTIGGAMAGLLLGGVMRGGAGTESAAAERVITAYAAEGIDLGKQAPRKALQACRRLERADNKRQPLCQGDQTLARDTLDIFQTVLRTARTILAQRGDKGVWPLQEREAAWLAPLAYGARTRAS